MKIQVSQKSPASLLETRLFQQTNYWSHVKSGLGWEPRAFDISVHNQHIGDVLILVKSIGGGCSMAYSPYGPECFPDNDLRGKYLTALSRSLQPFLGSSCVFVRWDIPWESPYAEDPDRFDENGNWIGPPETRLRELRMNWGVEEVGLRKAPSDLLPPDTVILDIEEPETDIIKRMHPKTRYNIRLADRHEVRVREGGMDDMELWNTLYSETVRRNRITAHGPEYFAPLFGNEGSNASVSLLIAEAGKKPLAAMFLSVSSDQATYLYGASSDCQRNSMAPYALQWNAIRKAKEAHCTSYDMFGVSPTADPAHPMYGLYRFKRGFGGRMLHRQGAWDYPYDQHAYTQFLGAEFSAAGFNV